MDASEVETVVDKDCSLDLNPNPTHPRGSDESMESDDSIENVFDSKSNQVFIKEKGNAGNLKCFVPFVCESCSGYSYLEE